MPTSKKPVTVGLVSLGCAKNAVDLQVMAGSLLVEGIELASNPDEADVILVNTCAFIEAACSEANDEILRACSLKRSGKAKGVIVSGCLPQRYGAALAEKYPDVDGWLGIDHLFDLPVMVAGIVASQPKRRMHASRVDEPTVRISNDRNTLYEPPIPELTISGGVHAFLKIAEGCSHACAYCAIPSIRGRLRSRFGKNILAEARALVGSGVRELDVVGQDITAYGRDLSDGCNLASLLDRLDRMRGDFWIRLLYGYPSYVTDELLGVISSGRHICRYIDIPIQHSHPDMLRAMRRADTIRHMPSLVERIRSACPGAAMRTTCIVGFPGETEEHFEHLLDFVKEARFDQLGVFCFSPEKGTAAEKMAGRVPTEVAEERRRRLMLAQQTIVAERLSAFVGTKTRVLVERLEGDSAIARTEFQAPDVDGATIIGNAAGRVAPGEFAEVAITGYDGYDLVAEM